MLKTISLSNEVKTRDQWKAAFFSFPASPLNGILNYHHIRMEEDECCFSNGGVNIHSFFSKHGDQGFVCPFPTPR